MIVELANAMPLNLPFVTYHHEDQFNRLNAVKFMKKMKSIEHHWIPVAYYLAVEQKFYDRPPAYIDRSNHQAIRIA